jgi:2-keto-4-pentenoate hydratase/2-oxohepta-3-ene-1,7-dioic acid hydratase in catechol pathway
MRLATYTAGDAAQRVGAIVDDRITPIDAADMVAFIRGGEAALAAARAGGARAAAARPLPDVRLLAPISRPARNIVCVGLNYAEHVAESQSAADATLPQHPVFFSKPPQCVIGPDETIPWHGHVSTAIDWEAELAVIIGREGRDIDEAHALDHVFGYTCANDVTARDLQAKHQQWYKGKGLDGFCPLGPAIVTADEIGDPQHLDVALRVDGVEKQRSNTRHMIFSVARLISAWSAGMTLLPGDILLTGTPSGVGVGRTPPEFLRPGNTVEVEIERIGVLRNTVGAPSGTT